MKPRHLLIALVLLAELPIIAVLVVGWLISGLMLAAAVGVEHTAAMLRTARGRVARLARRAASWRQRRRRPPRVDRPAWGW